MRLAIEGGFDPEEITPHPPLRSEKSNKGNRRLVHDPAVENSVERTVLGGLKTKDIDVVVSKKDIGPVFAISVKGTTGAFRNLTNRMEEAIGDSTNLHIMYPGLVYGFLQVLRANRAGTPGLAPNDVAIHPDGLVVESVRRYHDALAELSGRRFVRDDLTRYERVAFVLAETAEGRLGAPFAGFPSTASPLRMETFFRDLYEIYDLRFPYAGPSLRSLSRNVWDENSPLFAEAGGLDRFEKETGYPPRLAY
ncbi:MAG: hypothetical protein H7A53_01605 [Akkermansiaceae bacterium]|nr:hypothetical protein [Akkermansiaceae bacterium]MCP5549582.1 hypothetical protein [Akkermansiaceae bacterium]